MRKGQGQITAGVPRIRILKRSSLRNWPLPDPHPDGDKEDRGAVLVIAGSLEIPGAAILAGLAALRAGAGKLALAVPAPIAQAVAVTMPEARVLPLPSPRRGTIRVDESLGEIIDRSSAVLIGPGMQDEALALALGAAVLERCERQAVVLDALALGVLRRAGTYPWLLASPHAGEMAALSGHAKEAVCSDPAAYAVEAARRFGACVALKGSATVIAGVPAGGSEEVWRFEGGDAGLATSGSGDVLAGLAAGLAARGLTPMGAGAWAVWAHAGCGKRLHRIHGNLGYLARELLDHIPRQLRSATRQREHRGRT